MMIYISTREKEIYRSKACSLVASTVEGELKILANSIERSEEIDARLAEQAVAQAHKQFRASAPEHANRSLLALAVSSYCSIKCGQKSVVEALTLTYKLAYSAHICPVCGMDASTPALPKIMHNGRTCFFCSTHCRDVFELSPETCLGMQIELVHERSRELEFVRKEMLECLSRAAEFKDDETAPHTKNHYLLLSIVNSCRFGLAARCAYSRDFANA